MFARRLWFKQLATAQALLVVTALLGAVHHKAAALHGYCSDHGEQVHLEQQQQSRPADRSADDRLRTTPCHVHGAHGCLFLDLLAQSYKHEARSHGLIGRLVQAACRLKPAVADHRPALSPLQLAPKSSPPA